MNRGLFLIGMFLLSACGGGGGAEPVSVNTPSVTTPAPPAEESDTASVPSAPVAHLSFVDVTADSGLDFSHGLTGDTMAAMVAGGVAVGDYNGDGWLDLYLVQGNSGLSMLFENQGPDEPLSFTDVAADAGVTGEIDDKASGPTFADYDGDGDLDLFVGGVEYEGVRVFNNLGDGSFADVTQLTGLTDLSRENNIGMAFGDYDQDDDLDLFIAHWTFTENELPTDSTQHLWRNNGDGSFTDVSDATLITQTVIEKPQDYSFSPTFADIDDDGDSDILLVADTNTSQVLINDGDLGGGLVAFSYATDRGVVSDEAGMGSSVADFDNDGDLDWFVSSISLGDDPTGGRPTEQDNAGFNLTGNRFYRNEGNGVFTDQTDLAGVRKGYWGWGSCAADFNNDGYLDIFHVNGMDDPETNAYLEDPSRLFINNGDGTFTEYSEPLGLVDRKSGRGVSCFDGDQDGDIDVLIANNNDSATLFRNDGGNQLNYLNVRLQGQTPNTHALGARVYLSSGGVNQMREIHNGSNYVSHNPTEQHFGLGNATTIDTVRVVWPDGTETSRSDINPYQRVLVSYPDSWSTDD
ncbi:MAG: CRTAC1 family protein [Pseudomonadota bacterium]